MEKKILSEELGRMGYLFGYKRGVPRKIITLTYNNETIITYEQ